MTWKAFIRPKTHWGNRILHTAGSLLGTRLGWIRHKQDVTGARWHRLLTSAPQVLKWVESAIQASKVHLLSTDHEEGGEHTWRIPFDPSLQEVTISLSGPGPEIEVRDPLGMYTPRLASSLAPGLNWEARAGHRERPGCSDTSLRRQGRLGGCQVQGREGPCGGRGSQVRRLKIKTVLGVQGSHGVCPPRALSGYLQWPGASVRARISGMLFRWEARILE